MTPYLLSVQGLTIEMTAENLSRNPWKKYERPSGTSPNDLSVDLTIALHGVPSREAIPNSITPHPVSNGVRFMDTGLHQYHLSLYQDHEDLILDFQDIGLWRIKGATGHAQGYLVQDQDSLLAEDPKCPFFSLPLIELLKWKGLFLIHAVVLEKNSAGLVLTGPPGRGKTTAGLALTRAGYQFLSDDLPFLREVDDGVEIIPWSQNISIRDTTTALFPELQDITQKPEKGRGRSRIKIDDLYPDAKISSCRPHVMLFTEMVTEPTSRLEPMTKVQAFQEFLHQSVLLHHRTMAKKELQAFSRLIETVDCYRLYSGQDFLELPTLIDPVMAQCVG